MKKSVLTSILLSGFSASTSFADLNRIDAQIFNTLQRGGVEIMNKFTCDSNHK